MKSSSCSQLNSDKVITTKFCTWHNSYVLVTCAKICCDLMASNVITSRQILHEIWIVSKKFISEMGCHPTHNFSITIEIWQKFHYAFIQILLKWLLQNTWHTYSDGLVQERCNFGAMAMELLLSCINPSIRCSVMVCAEFSSNLITVIQIFY